MAMKVSFLVVANQKSVSHNICSVGVTIILLGIEQPDFVPLEVRKAINTRDINDWDC